MNPPEMNPPEMNPPDWKLERMLLGELAAEDQRELERMIAADPSIAARLDALRRENEELLAKYPAPRAVREIERRRSTKTEAPRFRPMLIPAFAAAACAVIALAIFKPPVSDTRVKGDARLEIHRQVKDSSELLKENAVVHAGDVLQVSYVRGGQRYGVIYSVDGRGGVTLHYPHASSDSAQLDTAAGAIALPLAYELDDAPAFERFVFVTSKEPIDVSAVLAHAKNDDQPKPLEVSVFPLKKGSP